MVPICGLSKKDSGKVRVSSQTGLPSTVAAATWETLTPFQLREKGSRMGNRAVWIDRCTM